MKGTSNWDIVDADKQYGSLEGTMTASFFVVPPSRKDAATT